MDLKCIIPDMLQKINTQSLDLGNPQKIVIGLIADTHIGSWRRNLHPNFFPYLKESAPDLIFHAGDISVPAVLDELRQIAPVTAVQGNRDITSCPHLPEAVQIDLCSLSIFLTHGHAPFIHYLIDKTHYMRKGFRFPRYYEYFQQYAPTADLILFGHVHIPIHQQVGRQWFINPGAACRVDRHDPHPSFALLTVQREKQFSLRFKYL